ncbi:archease [Micromonospora cathayae]|uniref:Archease n=2 Tax=Micromonospora cathayae TaxID=3028804 RepID=A0ABY7ZK01_9ACTN|nr:archease [Micromonospora sp. HUAS 3]WDZ83207.1 archease [Micromonospora sp. HUAS 3]
MGRPSGRGHRRVPHTADVRIEAWAPTRQECLAEAVTALVATFADTGDAPASGTGGFTVPPGPDEDLLVAVLDEVVFRLETEGVVPVATEVVAADDGGARVRWRTVDTDAVTPVGAVPKAVSLHGLRFGPGASGWCCAVTLDV